MDEQNGTAGILREFYCLLCEPASRYDDTEVIGTTFSGGKAGAQVFYTNGILFPAPDADVERLPAWQSLFHQEDTCAEQLIADEFFQDGERTVLKHFSDEGGIAFCHPFIKDLQIRNHL
jgi:hypothetical protein